MTKVLCTKGSELEKCTLCDILLGGTYYSYDNVNFCCDCNDWLAMKILEQLSAEMKCKILMKELKKKRRKGRKA